MGSPLTPLTPLLYTVPMAKKPPFPFLLDALAPLHPVVKHMFGGHAVYIGDKIVFMLRDNLKSPQDNGLWLVFAEDITTPASKSLHAEFKSIRTIDLLQGAIKHWLILPADHPNFESESLHACDLALTHDPRLGRIPKSRS